MPIETQAFKVHPILTRVIRFRVAVELRKQGHTFDEAHELAGQLTDDMIHAGVEQTDGAVGAIGDGTILQKIIDFLSSPQGQALIALLIKILLGGA